MMYDILIIGAGVSGCAIARELSRYHASVCVLEKEEDVCCGTSKANSAVIHAGYDAIPGSMMAKLNVRGCELIGQLAGELDFPFQKTGSLVICFEPAELEQLRKLYLRGVENGVKGMKILTREETLAMEPGLSSDVYAALYAPDAGIVCPFELNIALAENAYENGAEFKFHAKVTSIRKMEDFFEVETEEGRVCGRILINAAGVFADQIHNMVCESKIKIFPRKGEYCLMDRSEGGSVSHVIFSLPGRYGKGILVTPTVHGNLLLGPTATDIEDKEDTATTNQGLCAVMEQAEKYIGKLEKRKIITSFAGLRAHGERGDFIIEETEVKGFIDCAGIESPGLTSCLAIGEMVAQILKDKMNLEYKADFKDRRKGITKMSRLSAGERNELIRRRPAYGRIVCRCESISEGEIVEAIHRPLGAKSLDGIKRRTRAGMGRCQAGFCTSKVMEILARENHIAMSEVTKSGGRSFMVKKQREEI